jgi:methionyl-tRNA formyltransferase
MNRLKIIFMGTPDFAVPALRALLAAGHEVVAVYSQRPRKAGRGMVVRKTPVHICAEMEGIAVFTPSGLKDEEEQRKFANHKADIAVVTAYGLILPGAILEAPGLGCINIHASLLPRWRGAAPIQRAIMAGDTKTGITIMQMDEGLDTGAMLAQSIVEIGPDMTAGELHDKLSKQGAIAIVHALQDLSEGTLQPHDGVSYADKIKKAETRINWNRPCEEVHNFIRGLSPFPGAWFEVEKNGSPERIKVLKQQLGQGAGVPGEVLDDALTIACKTGAVKLLEVQRAGKKPQAADIFLRGLAIGPATRLM